MKTLKGDRSIN